ncbi:MAG: hypothetical protein LBG82_06975 [Clostridiales Family XIII bacterium]|jgi:hypothetical protein|nr:hypothetical protein [Clostridiales Family XIII bacterium]
MKRNVRQVTTIILCISIAVAMLLAGCDNAGSSNSYNGKFEDDIYSNSNTSNKDINAIYIGDNAKTNPDISDAVEIPIDDEGDISIIKGTTALDNSAYSEQTELDGIFQSEEGYYAMETVLPNGEESIIPVDVINAEIKDAASIEELDSLDEIPDEIVNSIKNKYASQIRAGRDELDITITIPEDEAPDIEAIPAIKASAESVDSPGRDEVNALLCGTTISSYKGRKMKSVRVYYSNLSTEPFKYQTGSNTSAVASNVCSFALVGTSLVGGSVAVVSSGISLCQAFVNACGSSWITGSSNDYLYAYVEYELTEQWTYCQEGSRWNLGLRTERAVVKHVWNRTYFYNTKKKAGKANETNTYPNKVHLSKHYDSPDATAYANQYNPVSEPISIKIGNKTIIF